MRFPATPPAWEPILDEVSRRSHGYEFFRFSQEEGTRTDRYLHWDEFRHRVSPSDILTVEEKWAALRMSRSFRAQPVSLKNTQGTNFTFFLTQRAFEALHQIDLQCGGGSGFSGENLIGRETRDRYHVNSLIEEALTSSQIEGAAVTRSEAKEMLRQGRAPATKHEKMVMNNFNTMAKISRWKDEDLSLALILEIHREITAGTLENPRDEGKFRTVHDAVRVGDEATGEVFHFPPSADELPERVAGFCKFANERGMEGFLHPVIRSILLHFWIAYDHPFVDGNGRTARALFYWSMLRHGYWLAEFFSISHEILKAPKKYYRAFLHTETDGNDLNYFLLHQLDVILGSIAALQEYIRRKQEETARLKQFLAPGDFNPRQIALLKHAIQNPDGFYTVASHRRSHRISTQTATTDLTSLVDKGFLVRGKSGRAFRYKPVPDLVLKLEA